MLVPTSKGLIVILKADQEIGDIPFDQIRNLRVSRLGAQGFIECECVAPDGSWQPVKWSTHRKVAGMVVDKLRSLASAEGVEL
jgi:hypothetical protein